MSTSDSARINRPPHSSIRASHSSFAGDVHDLRLRSLPSAGIPSIHTSSNAHDATWRDSLRESGLARRRPIIPIPSTNRDVRRVHDFALSRIGAAGLTSDRIRSNPDTLRWQNSLRGYPRRPPALPVHHAHGLGPVAAPLPPPPIGHVPPVRSVHRSASVVAARHLSPPSAPAQNISAAPIANTLPVSLIPVTTPAPAPFAPLLSDENLPTLSIGFPLSGQLSSQSSSIQDVSGKREARSPSPREKKYADEEFDVRQASSVSSSYIQEDLFFSRILDPMIDKLIELGRAKLREGLEPKQPKNTQSDSESEKDWDRDSPPTEKGDDVNSQIIEFQKQILTRFNQHIGFPGLIKSAPYELGVGSLSLSPEENIEEKFNFIQSIWRNKLRNLDAYIRRSQWVLKKYEQAILSRFFGISQPLSQPIHIDLQQLGAETHNRGECILKVTYYLGDSRLGSIVYKPRSAETEIAILNVFAELNALPKDEKSGPNLPIYQIIPLENHEGSIWEFVDAEELSFQASQEIQRKIPEEQQKEAEFNLMRLHSICKCIGITDLHPQNILRRGPFWIPIDMEIIKQGAPTSLYPASKEPGLLRLTSKEAEIMQNFLRSHPRRLSRIAPINTAVLMELRDKSRGYQQAVELLFGKLHDTEMLVDQRILEDQIKNDFICGDVPFFTEREGIIYYGVEKIAIAKKGGVYATS